MIVELELVWSLFAKIKEINETPLEKIIWMRSGEVCDYPEELLKEWKFTGLSNCRFALEDWDEEAINTFLSSGGEQQ